PTENRVVHEDPWWAARTRARAGSIASDRYSSSPETSTTDLPFPGPSVPATTNVCGSAARAGEATRARSPARRIGGTRRGTDAGEYRRRGLLRRLLPLVDEPRGGGGG